ncbi:MAG TPA: S41 family peptidase [Ferruginibacter sp.]|nr:S41 family peptidase [Ferruginibacter sp.]
MKFLKNIFFLLPVLYLCSCATASKSYSPSKKYSRQQLQEDYSLLRNILEKKHPSLYWYTSKDSMDMYFNRYYAEIKDSMSEQQFGWKIIAPLTDKIHCGHTSFGMSKAYNNWVADKRFSSFPLFMKFWNDTMVVTNNLNRRDSILKRGTIVRSVNGMNSAALKDTLFGYMTEDGDANNVNYIRLSSNFPYYHRNVIGLSKNYNITYLDSTNTERAVSIPVFEQKKDSTQRQKQNPPVNRDKRESNKKRLLDLRSLAVDTVNNTAIITLNTFSTGRLRKFYRQTFRYIRKAGISNVVLDLRSNGGGRINLSTLLTKYVSRKPFKVADTSFAVAKSLRPYTRYVKNGFINNLGLFFLTKKNDDGHYHFGHWERKLYKPKKKNHFGGDLYVLINGSTFSASAIFCNAVKGQPGISLLGEEAGGGWYGNNGILIPDIILPNTHLKVRLPLFRLVQYNHVAKDGRGVVPDIYVGTDYRALLKGVDKKMQVVMEMIRENNKRAPASGNIK